MSETILFIYLLQFDQKWFVFSPNFNQSPREYAQGLFCKPSVIVLNLYRSMAGLIEPTRNWNDYMIRLCSTFVLKNVKQLGSFMQIDGNCLLYFGIIKCYLFICSVQFVHEFHPCGRPTERGKKKRLTSL